MTDEKRPHEGNDIEHKRTFESTSVPVEITDNGYATHGDGTVTDLKTGEVITPPSLPDDVSVRVLHSVPNESESVTVVDPMDDGEVLIFDLAEFPGKTTEEVFSIYEADPEKFRKDYPLTVARPSPPQAKTIEEVSEIMEGWKEETKVEPVIEAVRPKEILSLVTTSDLEKHGFALQPRNKATDPFTYRKWIMILESAGQTDATWAGHGYCCHVTMLMPMGKMFINMLNPDNVYFPEKASVKEVPCHFDGVILTAAELDSVLEMAFGRDPIFVFSPSEEVPHQNFWVEVAMGQINTKPEVN